jgi:cytochrome c oxidase assembly factor CtaG
MVVILLNFLGIHQLVRFVFMLFYHGARVKGTSVSFVDFWGGFYGIFLTDLTASVFAADSPFYVTFTHMVFFYVGAVMLINVLVAIMADALTQTTDYRCLVTSLRRLQVAMLIEQRCANFCGSCCRRTAKDKRLYRIQVTRTSMHLDQIA